jgi:hypothetical protein
LLSASAKEKLAAKNGDVKKLMVKEITALLFVCYSIHAPAKVLKPGLVELLLGKIAVNPGVLALSSTTSEVTPVVTAAADHDERTDALRNDRTAEEEPVASVAAEDEEDVV